MKVSVRQEKIAQKIRHGMIMFKRSSMFKRSIFHQIVQDNFREIENQLVMIKVIRMYKR